MEVKKILQIEHALEKFFIEKNQFETWKHIEIAKLETGESTDI